MEEDSHIPAEEVKTSRNGQLDLSEAYRTPTYKLRR
jgi:hypothetical protein